VVAPEHSGGGEFHIFVTVPQYVGIPATGNAKVVLELTPLRREVHLEAGPGATAAPERKQHSALRMSTPSTTSTRPPTGSGRSCVQACSRFPDAEEPLRQRRWLGCTTTNARCLRVSDSTHAGEGVGADCSASLHDHRFALCIHWYSTQRVLASVLKDECNRCG